MQYHQEEDHTLGMTNKTTFRRSVVNLEHGIRSVHHVKGEVDILNLAAYPFALSRAQKAVLLL